MKRNFALLLAIFMLSITALTACGNEADTTDNTDTSTTEDQTNMEEDSMDDDSMMEDDTAMEESTIPFSEVGENLYTAKSNYNYFSFEEGTGTCLDQGFPTNLIYETKMGKANMIKTADSSYAEDWTGITATGLITFDDVALDSGAAACVAQTSSGTGKAEVSCKVDEAEVCTATFTLYAHK